LASGIFPAAVPVAAMKFTTAAACEQVVWEMRLADYPRALNRSRMNNLYNGAPPYSDEEQRQNRINTNVNSLEGTKILHDARRQFATAFMTADPLFTVTLDYGPVWKRREWGTRITTEINKRIKASLPYLECRRSVFALNVLHGIAPAIWEDRERWCPDPRGIEDVLVPSNTLVSLKNLPFFAVFRQYTGAELWRMTHGPRVDPAWNLPLVERAIAWVDQQAQQLMSASWPEVWSPEKMSERVKQDGGIYASDSVPTIDTFDLYFWNDEGKKAGWNRRIILDAWGQPGVGGIGGMQPASNSRSDGKYGLGSASEFLYNPGTRKYADKLEQIIHFQFADASCVAPFRYHSVRSLGFLLYAVCQLQNRLRCKFNDHVFENLLQYFRVSNPADAERLTKVDLIDKGIIPEGLNFVPQAERWQVNDGVVEQALTMNRQTMADNSASFTQDFDFGKETTAETATRTMAKVNATAALVGAMLNQAYNYQQFQYAEIARRFCIKNSKDADVRKFRVECLKAGVPEEALNAERWDVQPVRVIGSGNKTLQVAMADKLMGIRPQLDPEGQKEVDRIYILANSDDAQLAERLVPQQRHISDSIHDAQLAAGTLMLSMPVAVKEGINHTEYVERFCTAWPRSSSGSNPRREHHGGGHCRFAKHGGAYRRAHSDHRTGRAGKAPVKQYGDDLKNLMNLVKAYAQRLQEAQQQQQQAGQGMDPEESAKIQATMMTAETKNRLASESHAQKTAQRQLQFEQQMRQEAMRHRAELAKTDLETAANIEREGRKAKAEAEMTNDE
jgi:hypothetical protein